MDKDIAVPRDTIIEPVQARKEGYIWGQEVDYFAEHRIDGETHTKDLGEYPDGVFLDSRQTFKPEYHIRDGWFSAFHSDGTLYIQDDFNKLIEPAQLTYPEGHPRAGEDITRCNMNDPDDAFLNHKFWEQRAEEGRLTIKGKDNFHGPITDMLRGMDEIGEGVGNSPTPGDILYDMQDPKVRANQEISRVNNTVDAYTKFGSMRDDPETMRQVLILLGEGADDELSLSLQQTTLMTYVSDDTGQELGQSKQQQFLKYASLTPPDRKVYLCIKAGIENQVIVDQGGMYVFRNLNLGSTMDDAFQKLQDKKFSSQLEALIAATSNVR